MTGGDYRFFVVINHDGGCSYSCHSDLYQAGELPDPTYGTITSEIFDYSSDNNSYTGACVTAAACGERLKVCVQMDAGEYDMNVFTNNTVGNYEDNFTGV
ncbi:MAG: hypothetical protein AAF808_04605, partial [Cyanobacteria bacterium P01_D01_bin.2]